MWICQTWIKFLRAHISLRKIRCVESKKTNSQHTWWVAQLVASFSYHERHHIFLQPLFQKSFFSFRRKAIWDVKKISGKFFAWIAKKRKQEHVVSFHVKACPWDKIIRAILKARGVQETVNWGLGKKKIQNRMVFCSACLEKPRVWFRRFWRSLRNACLGKPRVHVKSRQNMKDRLRHDEKCTYRYGRDLWLYRCRQHRTWTGATKRIWKYSRILNLRASKVCSELREWWLKEIQKLRRCKFTVFMTMFQWHCSRKEREWRFLCFNFKEDQRVRIKI